MSSEPCPQCQDLQAMGIADKCFFHSGAPADPFDITDEMRENDKYGKLEHISAVAEKTLAAEYGWQPEAKHPEAMRPEAVRPVA